MPGRIVVIGGSGFIGTRLVRRLLEAGHGVRIADKARSAAHPELTSLCDVRDLASLEAACEGAEVIVNLAAEHRDDVRPPSLYDEVNVEGARNTCRVARSLGVPRIVFTSSVAVYGFSDRPRDESAPPNPFNDYGRTKLEAEGIFRGWLEESADRSLTIVRPTVVFGEDNRGNVYNLLRQIARGPFVMIGDGTNRKSMAYVENVAAFLAHALSHEAGLHLFNYVDQPDFDMNGLVGLIRSEIGKSPRPGLRLPLWIGNALGAACDGVAAVVRRPLPISRIRVEKFCAATVFSAEKARAAGFVPPYDIETALRRTIEHEFGSS